MKTKTKRRSIPPAPSEPTAVGGRKLLFVGDVQALFGRREDGSFRASAGWVKRRVAPNGKMMIGRCACWWEEDVHAWILNQTKRKKQ